eukprot:c17092_g1_i2 orf=2-844(-)
MVATGPLPSFEEALCQWVKSLECERGTTSHAEGDAIESANVNPSQYPDRSNEACPRDSHMRGFKHNDCKVAIEKMGPRQGAISKHPVAHQRRRSSKGDIKVLPADPTNFRALVYEHTCKPSSPTASNGVTPPASPLSPHSITRNPMSHPTSPLTPHSITGNPSPLKFMSQPTSPLSPHSISSPVSPLSPSNLTLPSGFYSNTSQQANPSFNVNVNPQDFSSHLKVHLDFSTFNPFESHTKCNPNVGLSPNLTNNAYVPRRASMTCLGVLNEGENVPCNSSP